MTPRGSKRSSSRDTELDLAWLQIKQPGDRKFACIDVAAAAKMCRSYGWRIGC